MTLQQLTDRNIGDRVAEELRNAISSGRLIPGERLVERRIADELGVSHIPVREALARLGDEGLVERLPRRGARVAVLTQRDIEEISSLRVVLEQFVAVRVQERLTHRTEAELRKILRMMVEAAESGDTRRLFTLDRRFHERLWKLSDHTLLLGLVSQLRSRINGFLRAATDALEADALVAHAKMHENLLRAIVGGDPEAAEAAVAEHITTAAERLRGTLVADDDPAPRP